MVQGLGSGFRGFRVWGLGLHGASGMEASSSHKLIIPTDSPNGPSIYSKPHKVGNRIKAK